MAAEVVVRLTKAKRRWPSAPLWTQLRSIGNSTPIKSTIFIPVLGCAIIFNEQVVHLLQLSRERLDVKFFFGQSVPLASEPNISWRLLWIDHGRHGIADLRLEMPISH